ncbi:MAG: phosphatase PAP2 family protein [Prevotellaceae bacterium]|jgi:membrane-associated phospholipid phosphatase|nr:phosphatase PAP2 family protein [Prevotellaceae bacterium]
MNILRILLMLYFSVGYSLFLSARDTVNFSDTISSEQRHPNKAAGIISIAVPSAMVVYGALSFKSDAIRQLDYSTKNELLEDNTMWYNGWDDYFQFFPVVAAFGMKLCGVKSTHKLGEMAILYAASNLLAGGIVYRTKVATNRERPNGSNRLSFPSGHTATAFVVAEFLHQEYGDKSVWISISGYGIASLVGIARVYNNRHWVSDVVAGAGIGILSTKIVYLTYPCLQKTFGKKEKKYTSFIIPTYNEGKLGLSLTCIF